MEKISLEWRSETVEVIVDRMSDKKKCQRLLDYQRR